MPQNRFNDFTDFEGRRFEDVDHILEMDSYTGDVYRVNFDVDSPGFEDEVAEEQMIERISIHISRRKGLPRRASQTNGMVIPNAEYVGLTASSNVKINDRIVIKGQSYLVTNVERMGTKTEVILNKQENE